MRQSGPRLEPSRSATRASASSISAKRRARLAVATAEQLGLPPVEQADAAVLAPWLDAGPVDEAGAIALLVHKHAELALAAEAAAGVVRGLNRE